MPTKLLKKKPERNNEDKAVKNKRCLVLTSNDFPIKVTIVSRGMLVKPQELIIDIKQK